MLNKTQSNRGTSLTSEIQLGDRIKFLRLTQNRTLQEIADCCDLSRSMISKIENNKTVPSVATLVKIAGSLGTNISNLLEQDDSVNAIFASHRKSLDGLTITDKGYSIFPFASEYHKKKMQPFLFTARRDEVKAHSVSHEGEEFIYVVRGE